MLKGIPAVISPELLKILAEMGHGDTITIGDAFFASASMAKDGHLVRADGIPATTLLDAILQLFPLDVYAESAVTLMGKPDGQGGVQETEISKQFCDIIAQHDPKSAETAQLVDRFAFYDRARKSYAVLASGETAAYGCIILQKGVR